MTEKRIKKLKTIFPNIDWDDNDVAEQYISSIRYSFGVQSLTHKEWFWFHPSAFKLIFLGASIIGVLTLTFLMVLSIKLGADSRVTLILFIVLAVNCWVLFKKVKQFKNLGTLNFYDLFIK